MTRAKSHPRKRIESSHAARNRPVSAGRAIVLWFALMAPLTFWGLPSRDRDDLLFGGERAWDAQRYQIDSKIEARRTRSAGADTDLDPLKGTGEIVNLTATEADRAAILLGYRLYSRQPDEMITFMALQQMDPRVREPVERSHSQPTDAPRPVRWRFPDLDPKLYQYGGGYIYLIGAVVGATSVLGITHLSGDAGVYLTQPELFARFYVASRFVSLLFGAWVLLAVSKLARRAAGRTAGWLAMICVACAPVFITGVLEAKPHMPSVCMILWAVLRGLDYARWGRRRDALWAGVLGGYAFGLVLTGLVAVTVLAVLFFLRTAHRRGVLQHLLVAGLCFAAVYVLTNPYPVYNVLFEHESLRSNLANSTAMYSVGRFAEGAARVAGLLCEACGISVCLAGLIGTWPLVRRHGGSVALAAAPGLAILLICVAIGAGKPAEYARFLALPAILLCISTAALLAGLAARRRIVAALATVVVLVLIPAPSYVRSFVNDTRGANETRFAAGLYLREATGASDSIGVLQEPAPYAVPPLDFAGGSILFLPADRPADLNASELPGRLVYTADDDRVHRQAWWQAYYELDRRFPPLGTRLSPITWANKPVYVYRRRD